MPLLSTWLAEWPFVWLDGTDGPGVVELLGGFLLGSLGKSVSRTWLLVLPDLPLLVEVLALEALLVVCARNAALAVLGLGET